MRGRRREPLSPILVARPEARPAGSVTDWMLAGRAVRWHDGGSAPAAAGYDAGAAAASSAAPAASASRVGVDRRDGL